MRRLLKLKPKQDRFEIVYGQGAGDGEQVPVLTRALAESNDGKHSPVVTIPAG